MPPQALLDAPDHCLACRVERELIEHRDGAHPEWSIRKAALTFAVIVARQACPEYVPPATHRPTPDPEPAPSREEHAHG